MAIYCSIYNVACPEHPYCHGVRGDPGTRNEETLNFL